MDLRPPLLGHFVKDFTKTVDFSQYLPPSVSRVTSTSWKEVEGKVMEKVGICPLSLVYGPLMTR